MLGSTGICASVVVRVRLSASGLAAIGVAVILKFGTLDPHELAESKG
jgi:hypothetical protein